MFLMTSLLILAWIIVSILLGMHNIERELGGVVVFFYSLPIISFLACKQKYAIFRLVIWSLAICLSSIIIINYLYMSLNYHRNVNIVTLLDVYILIAPLALMTLPYITLIELSFGMRPIKSSIIYEVPEQLRLLAGFSIASFLIPILALSPLIINPLNVSASKYASGFRFGLLAFNLGAIWLFIYIRDINADTMIYFSVRMKHAIPYNPNNVYKIIPVVIVLVIWSVTEEFLFRRNWILLLESFASIVPLFLIFSRITKILVGSGINPVSVQPEVGFPSLRNGKHFGILIMFIMVGFICWIFY